MRRLLGFLRSMTLAGGERDLARRDGHLLGSFQPTPPQPVNASIEEQPPTDYDG